MPRALSEFSQAMAGFAARFNSPGVCPPPKRYKIGELVAFTGLTRQTLHNYTHWGLIREVAWTQGGHRLYDESVFPRLAQIMAMRDGATVAEIRDALDAHHQDSHKDA